MRNHNDEAYPGTNGRLDPHMPPLSTPSVQNPLLRTGVDESAPGRASTKTPASSVSESETRTTKTPKARKVLLALLALVIVVGGVGYLVSLGHESTDDAQVDGHLINVASRVGGQISEILVKDNQMVKEGDPLVTIDGSELKARAAAAHADVDAAKAALAAAEAQRDLAKKTAVANLKQAKGALEQAASGLDSSHAMVAQAKADLVSARARFRLASTDLERVKQLRSEGAVSAAEFDTRQSAYDQAKGALDLAMARLNSARSGISGSTGTIETAKGRLDSAETVPLQVQAAEAAVEVANARLEQAQAAAQLADLNVSYTTVKAPSGGLVSRRTAEVGQVVAPGTPLLAIVPLDDVWITANFKEDQIADMRPGQTAHVKIDALGSHSFTGHVDSIAAAAGAKFSLLPPDNASGNFVKVVQRVPVLVRLENLPKDAALRPGMSAYITVDTGR